METNGYIKIKIMVCIFANVQYFINFNNSQLCERRQQDEDSCHWVILMFRYVKCYCLSGFGALVGCGQWTHPDR